MTLGRSHEHDNNVRTTNQAFYTQGDYQISDTLSVTLGVRYSEDSRDARERVVAILELAADSYPWLNAVLAGVAGAAGDDALAAGLMGEGVTPLAALNVAMGAATLTVTRLTRLRLPVLWVAPNVPIHCG